MIYDPLKEIIYDTFYLEIDAGCFDSIADCLASPGKR